MKTALWLPPVCLFSLFFASCASRQNAGNPLETGPFDSAGNYREDWVNDPAKWTKPNSKKKNADDELPLVAMNDQPPANASPLASSAVRNSPKPTARPSERSSEKPTQKSATVTKQVQSSPRQTAQRSETARQTTSKPKAKQQVAKTTAKPKKQKSYVVKNGDSLAKIASRTGSTVTGLQSANGISGTLIHPGKVLIIPSGKR